MASAATNRRATRSTKNTPTTSASTLPGSTTTPARNASDAPTDETLSTPTPAPGRVPSRQGSVPPLRTHHLCPTRAPPLPKSGARPHRPRHPSHSLPWSRALQAAWQLPPTPPLTRSPLMAARVKEKRKVRT
ncbi:hypothetical protein K438DRAFT_1764847 [Mycena galopus ATCC 62051]|nr:hypothetical protein K438DRAFT_1764847 [Mycena galopus ATCC 62051]